MDKQQLIDATLKQIVEDVENGDLTAIEVLLMDCHKDAILNYLPETMDALPE